MDIEQLSQRAVAAVRDLLQRTVESLKVHVAKQVAPLEERIAALEAQVGEFKYCGTWDSARTYERGNFTTYDGSIWHCNRRTTQRPGPGDAWSLAVKRGVDAKGAR